MDENEQTNAKPAPKGLEEDASAEGSGNSDRAANSLQPVQVRATRPGNHGGRLAPKWLPGQSGNPMGRRHRGLSIEEWANIYGDWTRQRVEAVIGKRRSTIVQLAAAEHVLGMANGTIEKGKRVGLPDMQEALDRGLGKTPQAIHMTSEESTTIRVVLLDRTASPTHKMVEEIMRGGALEASEPKQLEAKGD